MATRKSKTIRANPLDAISAVSMEKVKAPIKNARPKKTAQPAFNSERGAPNTVVETRPATPEKVKAVKSVLKTKPAPLKAKPEKPNSEKTKVESIKPEKIKVETRKPEKNQSESAKPIKRTPLKRMSAIETTAAKSDVVPETLAPEQMVAPEQTLAPESKPAKKCAEDVFEQELQELKVNAGNNKKPVLPDLPPEAFAAVENAHAGLIIKQWAQWSAVGSMVPAPFMGTVLISAAQIKMIHSLCKTYNVPFERNVAVAVATGLVGGSVASGLAQLLGRLVIKTVPYLGAAFTIAVEPALSYASSYAIGMSFVKHFEAGGTLENFNAREMKSYFSENVTRCLTYLRDRKKSIFASKSVQS